MMESTVIISGLIIVALCGLVGIWNNWLGHNPYMPYSSVPPFWKFYGYPLWNIMAFFSFGKLKKKSWRDEFNNKLREDGLGCYIH